MEKQYVGIDLHRRRSVIVRKDAAGELLETVQIDNDPIALAEVWRGPGRPPRSSWRRRTGGIGRRTCWPSAGPACIWRTRWVTAGEPAGEKRRARRHRPDRLVTSGTPG